MQKSSIDETYRFPKIYNSKKPPQFITTIEFQENEEFDIQDKIYVDNIQRTAVIFSYFDQVSTVPPGKPFFIYVIPSISIIILTIYLKNNIRKLFLMFFLD